MNAYTNNDVLVGHDVTVFGLQNYGTDGLEAAGTSASLLGYWKDIQIELMNEWDDVTPSSEILKERRWLSLDWRARLNFQVRQGGSEVFYKFVQGVQLVLISFIEESGGDTVLLLGGIERGTYERDRQQGSDSLEVINVGRTVALAGYSFGYL